MVVVGLSKGGKESKSSFDIIILFQVEFYYSTWKLNNGEFKLMHNSLNFMPTEGRRRGGNWIIESGDNYHDKIYP